MSKEDDLQIKLLEELIAELPGLCAAPDGFYYAQNHTGIQCYKDIEARIRAKLEEQRDILIMCRDMYKDQ